MVGLSCMIYTVVISIAVALANLIFSLLPDFPQLDPSVISYCEQAIPVLMENGASILNLFLDMNVFQVCVGIIASLAIAEPIYYIVRALLSLIPILDI